ncbi:hypothetical protein K439DRAFT_1610645 [Ramaria rubella]|nr:hypothetical protein K439DRAFT_1610645 [Ramaria rubella]
MRFLRVGLFVLAATQAALSAPVFRHGASNGALDNVYPHPIPRNLKVFTRGCVASVCSKEEDHDHFELQEIHNRPVEETHPPVEETHNPSGHASHPPVLNIPQGTHHVPVLNSPLHPLHFVGDYASDSEESRGVSPLQPARSPSPPPYPPGLKPPPPTAPKPQRFPQLEALKAQERPRDSAKVSAQTSHVDSASHI